MIVRRLTELSRTLCYACYFKTIHTYNLGEARQSNEYFYIDIKITKFYNINILHHHKS